MTTTSERALEAEKKEQCPRCFGRGYIPEARKSGKPGFYARNCPRCIGTGEIKVRAAIARATGREG